EVSTRTRQAKGGFTMLVDQFEVTGNRGYHRVGGTMPFKEAVELVNDGIVFARRRGLRELIVDTRELDGFEPPDIESRIWMGQKWGFSAREAVTFAVIARPEMIDPEKFGVIVARNRGAVANVFVSEQVASSWLSFMNS